MSWHRILKNDVKMANANSSDFADVYWKDFLFCESISQSDCIHTAQLISPKTL